MDFAEEVLEHILLFVPPASRTPAAQVCSDWRRILLRYRVPLTKPIQLWRLAEAGDMWSLVAMPRAWRGHLSLIVKPAMLGGSRELLDALLPHITKEHHVDRWIKKSPMSTVEWAWRNMGVLYVTPGKIIARAWELGEWSELPAECGHRGLTDILRTAAKCCSRMPPRAVELLTRAGIEVPLDAIEDKEAFARRFPSLIDASAIRSAETLELVLDAGRSHDTLMRNVCRYATAKTLARFPRLVKRIIRYSGYVRIAREEDNPHVIEAVINERPDFTTWIFSEPVGPRVFAHFRDKGSLPLSAKQDPVLTARYYRDRPLDLFLTAVDLDGFNLLLAGAGLGRKRLRMLLSRMSQEEKFRAIELLEPGPVFEEIMASDPEFLANGEFTRARFRLMQL